MLRGIHVQMALIQEGVASPEAAFETLHDCVTLHVLHKMTACALQILYHEAYKPDLKTMINETLKAVVKRK